MVRIDFRSLLKEQTTLRWGFLDASADPCAVVTARMELLYINDAGQALVPADWFSRRCFEVLPTHEALCAMDCPTILAVHTATDVAYCEETLDMADGTTVTLGTAVIPLRGRADDGAQALLLFRRQPSDFEPDVFARRLLADGRRLSDRVAGDAPRGDH